MGNKIIQMPENVKHIIETLESNGYEAFAVGGCVRDALMGRTPNDWDITTSAKIEFDFEGNLCVASKTIH